MKLFSGRFQAVAGPVSNNYGAFTAFTPNLHRKLFNLIPEVSL